MIKPVLRERSGNFLEILFAPISLLRFEITFFYFEKLNVARENTECLFLRGNNATVAKKPIYRAHEGTIIGINKI